jgi:hypothetical protein
MSGKSKLDEIQFYLNILESSGKNIVNRYVETIRTRLSKKNLTVKFEIITNDAFYNSTQGGDSGDVTFPYAYFKHAFDRTVPNAKIITTQVESDLEHDDDEDDDEDEDDEEDDEEDDDEDDEEDDDEDDDEDDEDDDDENDEESENIEDSNKPTIIDSMLKYEPLMIDTVDNSRESMNKDVSVNLTTTGDDTDNAKYTLNIPTNYTGVISILVTIPYPKEDNPSVIEGGIAQLNQFINNYEENQ